MSVSPRRFACLITTITLASALAGCAREGVDGTTEPEPTTTTTQSPDRTVPTIPTVNPNTAPDSVVDKAIADLMTRIDVDREDVEILISESKTWNDGSIGCPQPGMSYTQALVDGSRVLLRANDRLYDYHAGSNGEPFLCESGEKDGGYDFVPPPGFND